MNFRCLLLLGLGLTRLPAVLTDEIQVYADDIKAPGRFGHEFHAHPARQSHRRPDFPGEVTPAHGGNCELQLKAAHRIGPGLPFGPECHPASVQWSAAHSA